MSLTFEIDSMTKADWERHSRTFDNYNLYQTWDYAAFHSPHSSTRDVIRCVVLRDGEPRVMGQFRVKKIPVLGVGVAELEWGPLWRVKDTENQIDAIRFFLDSVCEELRGRRGLEVRLFPHTTHPYDCDDLLMKEVHDAGFTPWLDETRNYDTVMIDFSKDLDTLRLELHQKWRNLLKKAEKSELRVESGRDVRFFDRFIALYEAMREVKDFPTGVRVPVIRQMQESLPEPDRFLVSVAVDGDRDIGASVCAMTGERMLYFLGASHPELRESAPGYLLQWHHIQVGKELGIRWYDLGGMGSEGVGRFKTRMGGEIVSFPRRCLIEASPTRSTLFRKAEQVFDKMRR